MNKSLLLTLCLVMQCADAVRTFARDPAENGGEWKTLAPAVLPGKGLAEHDFLFAGEAKELRISIVRKGRVVWSYVDSYPRGEISDAVMLSNGNVLFAYQFGVKLISPEKKVLWSYVAAEGTEIHTAVPIGLDHVLFVQNGPQGMIRVVNLRTGKFVQEITIPVGLPGTIHRQFRHARLTPAGTLMVGHIDLNEVVEYDATGKKLWSHPARDLWGVTPLQNGNVLIVDGDGVHEVNHRNEIVWNFAQTDSPDYKLLWLQLAWRLPNGNTLLNNWDNPWRPGYQVDRKNPPAQALEVTADKKVVWALSSWANPDLFSATTIQLLDDPVAAEDVRFGAIK